MPGSDGSKALDLWQPGASEYSHGWLIQNGGMTRKPRLLDGLVVWASVWARKD